MSTVLLDLAPFIPSDQKLAQSSLPDKALELNKESAKLTGQLSPLTLATLEQYMRVINSYYSNLIEGNVTRPHEIRAAQRGDYSGDSAKRDLQKESLGHMAVQHWVSELNPDLMYILILLNVFQTLLILNILFDCLLQQEIEIFQD